MPEAREDKKKNTMLLKASAQNMHVVPSPHILSVCQSDGQAQIQGAESYTQLWGSSCQVTWQRQWVCVEHRKNRTNKSIYLSSVQFSCSVVSDSLWPRGLQHTRPPCPSPTHRVYSNSCPSSQWCHPAISSSVIPFSSCPQSLPASGSFSMSQFFPSGGQSIGVSASASVLPMNIQDWFPLGWTAWVSLLSKTRHLSLLQHHSSKASILLSSAFFIVQLSHPYMTTGKTIVLTR